MTSSRTMMLTRSGRTTARAGALLTVGALLLAACGGDDGEDAVEAAPAGAQEMTSVTMGVAASLTSIPVYLADTLGYFEEEGLDVELQVAQSGAATIPQLLNGQLQFSIADTVATISAVANDVPLQIISTDVVGASSGEEDFVGVVSSTIGEGDLAALEGKTLAVNQLKGLAELLSRATLDEAGVDSDSVNFIEVAPPDMVAAVEQGRVDAAYLLEPFLSQGLAADLTPVFNITDVSAGLPIVSYSTSQQYAQEQPEVVERFNRAIAKATAYAGENPDEARETAGTYTNLPPEVLAGIRLPTFSPDATDTSGVSQIADLMVTYGFLEEAPDTATFVTQG